jgi:hypothetical protein
VPSLPKRDDNESVVDTVFWMFNVVTPEKTLYFKKKIRVSAHHGALFPLNSLGPLTPVTWQHCSR